MRDRLPERRLEGTFYLKRFPPDNDTMRSQVPKYFFQNVSRSNKKFKSPISSEEWNEYYSETRGRNIYL